MTLPQDPRCECGHLSGDHARSGVVSLSPFAPPPPRRGRCSVTGCGCGEFREASDEPKDAA